MFAGGESENSSYATVGAKCPVACERASDPADRAIGIPSGTQRRLELARRLRREISRHDVTQIGVRNHAGSLAPRPG